MVLPTLPKRLGLAKAAQSLLIVKPTAIQTSSIETRRPTIAAARCKLASVISLVGSSSRSTGLRLVLLQLSANGAL